MTIKIDILITKKCLFDTTSLFSRVFHQLDSKGDSGGYPLHGAMRFQILFSMVKKVQFPRVIAGKYNNN